MGLWPEIHRAWAAVDDELIVWNYEGDAGESGRESGDYWLVCVLRWLRWLWRTSDKLCKHFTVWALHRLLLRAATVHVRMPSPMII